MWGVRAERAWAVVREIGNVAAWMQNGCYLSIRITPWKNSIDIDHSFLSIDRSFQKEEKTIGKIEKADGTGDEAENPDRFFLHQGGDG